MNLDNNPLVSVLIPSYNHKEYIKEAIMSVINQTYKNLELIVIDDGSNDGSAEIIESLQREFGFIYKHRENKGLLKTLEELFLMSSGEYISLFSSDDIYANNKIEELVLFLEKNRDYGMVYSKIGIIDSYSKITGYIKESYKSGFIFDDLLQGTYFINGVGTLIRRDVYQKYIRIDEYIDDFQFWLMIAKFHKVGFVDKYLSFYRRHNNHLTGNSYKMQQSEFRIISRYKDEPIYKEAFRKWNIRWLGSFGKCNKIYAIKHFLFKNITYRNFFDLNFYKSLLKLLIPCFIFKRIR